jgi:hypothetical protein
MMVAILRLTTSMPSGSVFAKIRALALATARVSQWNKDDCRTTIQDLRHSLPLERFRAWKKLPLLTAGYEAIDGLVNASVERYRCCRKM